MPNLKNILIMKLPFKAHKISLSLILTIILKKFIFLHQNAMFPIM